MPIYIYEEDALDKMVLIEGEEWREHVKKFGVCSFQAFLDKWERDYKEMEHGEIEINSVPR